MQVWIPTACEQDQSVENNRFISREQWSVNTQSPGSSLSRRVPAVQTAILAAGCTCYLPSAILRTFQSMLMSISFSSLRASTFVRPVVKVPCVGRLSFLWMERNETKRNLVLDRNSAQLPFASRVRDLGPAVFCHVGMNGLDMLAAF